MIYASKKQEKCNFLPKNRVKYLVVSQKSSNFAPNMQNSAQHIFSRLRTVYSEPEAHELTRWMIEEQGDESALLRLLRGEPVQYVFRHALWLGLDLLVTPDVLIPRPETAELITPVCALKKDYPATPTSPVRLLDIGTGSGCIAIALKQRCPRWEVYACDISLSALSIAKQNARRNNTDIRFLRCDILHDSPEGSFDIIVSNPPYVCEQEKSSMESRVLDYEPASALFVPDNNPLLFYHRIAKVATTALRPNGHLFFEVNERFARHVADALLEYGFADVTVLQDMFGKNRFVTAIWKPTN